MNAVGTALPEPLARASARHAQRYPYKVWGFGEDIALRALIELGDSVGDPQPAAFVRALVDDWLASRGPLVPADHVAPGVVLLELHARHGDGAYLDAAVDLGRLLASFPASGGVSVHRRDLAGWSDTIWVDCMALDGPFLARLARTTGDERWVDRAAGELLGYARVLQDDECGLFAHGYDVAASRASAVRWGRGNGWALHGLVDTLEALPAFHPAAGEARTRLARLVDALAALQHPSGRWRTVLDDDTSPFEASLPAFFASGMLKARRLSLLPDELVHRLGGTIERAVAALVAETPADGGLAVSEATPVGDRETYVDRAVGVLPWGQGPLLLTFTEARRGAAWRHTA